MKYCPMCTKEMVRQTCGERIRLICPNSKCGYVFWNNPIPVVAGIVETPEGVVLAHNKAWRGNYYSIITGFLEEGECPTEGIIRETQEELALQVQSVQFVGLYPFHAKNQLIIVYHVTAYGRIVLNEELDGFKILSRRELQDWPFGMDKLRGWPFGAGNAITDWLRQVQIHGGGQLSDAL